MKLLPTLLALGCLFFAGCETVQAESHEERSAAISINMLTLGEGGREFGATVQ